MALHFGRDKRHQMRACQPVFAEHVLLKHHWRVNLAEAVCEVRARGEPWPCQC